MSNNGRNPSSQFSGDRRRRPAASSGDRRACFCSPTKHPGSFRCRLHKAPPSSPAPAPARSVFRRSAVANSVARAGAAAGEWERRALMVMIRPSSNGVRRRAAAFEPRPSRLSVMSKVAGAGEDD